ncbi:MAG: hypothetical protein ACI97A_002638 [Planctomycetota bacterium]|jgi:hypothetical protein
MKCPNCAADLDIDQGLAHFAVCTYCQSSLIVDREAIKLSGKMATLRPPLGPLALGFTGSVGDKGFNVLGRVRYAYEAGFWDEWFLGYEDGTQGWISQDEDRLVLEELVEVDSIDASSFPTEPGETVQVASYEFVVRERGQAVLEAAEGQLPFPIHAGATHPFLDLVGDDATSATLEFDDDQTRLFVGRLIGNKELRIDQDFSDYQKDSLNPEAGSSVGRRKRVVKQGGRELGLNCESCGGSLQAPEDDSDAMTCRHCGSDVDLRLDRIPCPSCKATIAIHNIDKAVQVNCASCHARVATSDRATSLLEEANPEVTWKKRKLALGSRCRLLGHDYRLVGFVRLVEYDEGRPYYSREYLLYDREVGYRWLSEYQGHFTVFNELKSFPKTKPASLRRKKTFTFRDRSWKVFEKGHYKVDFVDGELPWVCATGDTTHYVDAIDPPYMLSAEWTQDELSWSEGLYLEPKDVADAFGLKLKELPIRRGVGANQLYVTTPFKTQSLKVMGVFMALAIVFAVWSANTGFEHEETVTVNRSDYDQEFMTAPFEINSAPCLCEFEFTGDVNNQWIYLDVALIDEEDNAIMDFSSEMSYYHGVEGGESWSEGSRDDQVAVRLEKNGKYRLLLKGESGTGEAATTNWRPNQYTVKIKCKEKVVLTRYYVVFGIACLLWILGILIPRMVFEGRRWSDE